jgi:aspartate carbamoyltransferase catalytic subunit
MRTQSSALRSKDLLGIEPLSPEEINLILDTAEGFKEVSERPVKKVPALRGQLVINLFMEPSTRTRVSFEIAEKRLSADTLNFAASGSAVEKGETLIDTAQNLMAMRPDMIVMRHKYAGSPKMLADRLPASVINAGDGAHEHPTQALLDAFTIRERLGRLQGVNISIIGDIAHSRVVRSNIHLLTKMKANVTLAAPPTLMPVDIEKTGVRVVTSLDEALEGADVVMMLRIQLERQGKLSRVLQHVRTDTRAPAARQTRRRRHAPRTDEPRRRDRVGRRGWTVFGDSGSSHERCRRAHGGFVSAGGRTPCRVTSIQN